MRIHFWREKKNPTCLSSQMRDTVPTGRVPILFPELQPEFVLYVCAILMLTILRGLAVPHTEASDRRAQHASDDQLAKAFPRIATSNSLSDDLVVQELFIRRRGAKITP
jgi:hypothetical protein